METTNHISDPKGTKSKSSQSKEKEDRKYLDITKIAIRTALGVFTVWLLNWILVEVFCSVEVGGQFGDRFGVTTSLFGGLTIVGLFLTIFLQRQEIAIAKKEFRDQNRTLRYQRFDNTFFNMLNLHNEIVKNLNIFWNGNAFDTYQHNHIESMSVLQNKEQLVEKYQTVVLSFTLQHFMQYINNFESTVMFILKGKRKRTNQNKYLRLYFAQLSYLEKIFYYYYYNLTSKPIFWNRCKMLLFKSIQSNHLHQPLHTAFLDGIEWLPPQAINPD